MRSQVTWPLAALAGVLLGGACSKEPASAVPAPASQPAQAPAPAEEPAASPEEESEEPSQKPQAAAEEAGPPEFTVGQKREEVVRLFGDCAERIAFEPPGPNKLYVEIYQAKNTEACKERLGQRQFTIRGGELYQITPGWVPPPPPATASSTPAYENL